jgi:hypothetical protein
VLLIDRLPPVLIVSFKRFVSNGRWRDKINTPVSFPLRLAVTEGGVPDLILNCLTVAGVLMDEFCLPMQGTEPWHTLSPAYRYECVGVCDGVMVCDGV